MTATLVPSQAPPLTKPARDPSYEFARREADVVARFPSGKRLPVTRDRVRAYPGLTGTAPSTLAFYQAFAPLLQGRHVLDAGTGSGAGARLLSEHAPHVTAVDSDARALAFAREYAPSVDFLHADLCHGTSIDRADAAFLVDVLGHLARPEAALRGLRACLPVGSQLFVAEPRAYASQRLLAPACRAFSRTALSRLLLRAGFDVDTPLSPSTNFVALIARRADDPSVDALAEGLYQAARGQFSSAAKELARARESARADVQLEALLGEAELALAEGDGDGAVRRYFEANELDNGDGRALSGLAHIALRTGNKDDALRLALDALKREPTELSANAAMAIAAEQLSHPDAFNAWRIAANLAPHDLDVAAGLARVSAARGNFAFAIQVFERLRGYGAALGMEFHVTLGWLLLADGRKRDASVEARFAAVIAPENEAVTELVQAIETPQ